MLKFILLLVCVFTLSAYSKSCDVGSGGHPTRTIISLESPFYIDGCTVTSNNNCKRGYDLFFDSSVYLTNGIEQSGSYLCPMLKGSNSCCDSSVYDKIKSNMQGLTDFFDSVVIDIGTFPNVISKIYDNIDNYGLPELAAKVPLVGNSLQSGVVSTLNFMEHLIHISEEWSPEFKKYSRYCQEAFAAYEMGVACIGCTKAFENYVTVGTVKTTYKIHTDTLEKLTDACLPFVGTISLKFLQEYQAYVHSAEESMAGDDASWVSKQLYDYVESSITDSVTNFEDETARRNSVRDLISDSVGGLDISFILSSSSSGALHAIKYNLMIYNTLSKFIELVNKIPTINIPTLSSDEVLVQAVNRQTEILNSIENDSMISTQATISTVNSYSSSGFDAYSVGIATGIFDSTIPNDYQDPSSSSGGILSTVAGGIWFLIKFIFFTALIGAIVIFVLCFLHKKGKVPFNVNIPKVYDGSRSEFEFSFPSRQKKYSYDMSI